MNTSKQLQYTDKINFVTNIQLSGEKGQIINLGAGFDTLYWRLKEAGKCPANFIELDFPSITARKCYHIKKHKQLIDTLNTEGKVLSFVIFFFFMHGSLLIVKIYFYRWRNQIFNNRSTCCQLSLGGNRSTAYI